VSGRADSRARSLNDVRRDLGARLRARTPEIEQAIFSRISEMPEPMVSSDPAYLAGVRATVTEALKYSLEGIETDREQVIPIPPEAARQARRAAREGVRLDTVFRRYAAGNTSLEEFIVAEAADIPNDVLCQVLSDKALRFDRLMESVSVEYRDELEQTRQSSAQKQAARILHFLESSSLVGPPDLDYDFDSWHIGMILTGDVGPTMRVLRGAADRAGYRLLTVARDHQTTWAWLGCSAEPSLAGLVDALDAVASAQASVAVGEPRRGLDGWRQTFREAQAALQVLLYRPQPIARCRDVILVSAVVRDPTLATSLIETYLAPLNGRSDSGEVLRKTLRAYFQANQNANTAAAALRVARHTVERRLRSVEEKVGQTIDTCNAQLQVALWAEELLASSGHVKVSSGG
jgi:hypothetical protein